MHILFITQLIIYNRKTTINFFLFIVMILSIVIVTPVEFFIAIIKYALDRALPLIVH